MGFTGSVGDWHLQKTQPERIFPLLTDSYKQTHYMQYPLDTQVVYSYMEPRDGSQYRDIVWIGLQFILKEYGFIGNPITREMIEEAAFVCKDHFGHDYFNREGWRYILNEYGGKLPLRIYALPEGSIIKPGTPVMAIENTDEKVPWLTNFVESLLLHAYAATNTASISYDIYKMINEFCDLCGEKVLPVHLNDFGLRGASSLMSAELCGIGHLAIFTGTDNIPAMDKIRWYYGGGVKGVSVMAAEHSTIMAWGKDNELEAYRHIIGSAPDDAYVAVISDTYDWRHAIKEYFCKELKEQILARKGTVVIRLDSGVPWDVSREAIHMLWEAYGGTINEEGYKVLDPHIRLIYSDGINADSIEEILHAIVELEEFATSNIIFGCGATLIQNHNRDTCNVAIKCSAVKRNNVWYDVHKTSTDKVSKGGRFDLPLVYENGKLLIEEDFDTIRKRIGILV